MGFCTYVYIYLYLYMDLCTYYALEVQTPFLFDRLVMNHHFSFKGLSSFNRNPTICSMLATTHPGLHPFSLENVQLSPSEHFPPGPTKTLGSGWEGCFLVSQSPHLFRDSRLFSFEFYRSGDIFVKVVATDLPLQSLT